MASPNEKENSRLEQLILQHINNPDNIENDNIKFVSTLNKSVQKRLAKRIIESYSKISQNNDINVEEEFIKELTQNHKLIGMLQASPIYHKINPSFFQDEDIDILVNQSNRKIDPLFSKNIKTDSIVSQPVSLESSKDIKTDSIVSQPISLESSKDIKTDSIVSQPVSLESSKDIKTDSIVSQPISLESSKDIKIDSIVNQPISLEIFKLLAKIALESFDKNKENENLTDIVNSDQEKEISKFLNENTFETQSNASTTNSHISEEHNPRLREYDFSTKKQQSTNFDSFSTLKTDTESFDGNKQQVLNSVTNDVQTNTENFDNNKQQVSSSVTNDVQTDIESFDNNKQQVSSSVINDVQTNTENFDNNKQQVLNSVTNDVQADIESFDNNEQQVSSSVTNDVQTDVESFDNNKQQVSSSVTNDVQQINENFDQEKFTKLATVQIFESFKESDSNSKSIRAFKNMSVNAQKNMSQMIATTALENKELQKFNLEDQLNSLLDKHDFSQQDRKQMRNFVSDYCEEIETKFGDSKQLQQNARIFGRIDQEFTSELTNVINKAFANNALKSDNKRIFFTEEQFGETVSRIPALSLADSLINQDKTDNAINDAAKNYKKEIIEKLFTYNENGIVKDIKFSFDHDMSKDEKKLLVEKAHNALQYDGNLSKTIKQPMQSEVVFQKLITPNAKRNANRAYENFAQDIKNLVKNISPYAKTTAFTALTLPAMVGAVIAAPFVAAYYAGQWAVRKTAGVFSEVSTTAKKVRTDTKYHVSKYNKDIKADFTEGRTNIKKRMQASENIDPIQDKNRLKESFNTTRGLIMQKLRSLFSSNKKNQHSQTPRLKSSQEKSKQNQNVEK
ncbi:MAG: hypothetical protein ISN64_00230 [Rickettsia sp.]|nr:hypothetical protein [Rickettsia sp.]